MASAMTGYAPASELAPALSPPPAKAVQPDSATTESSKENSTTSQPVHTPHKSMSKGEKVYNWGVYSGINYWLNLASSIVIADYFCNLSGKKIIEKGADAIAKTFSGGNAQRQAKIFGQTSTALRTLTLLSGGWLLIVPIKMMEDNKRPLVHWLNKKMGVDQTGPDGKELTPDQIYIEQEQPKHSWLRVILRRSLATAAVMATGQLLNEGFRDRPKSAVFKTAHPDSKEDPHGGKSRVEHWVVQKVNDGLNSGYIPGGKSLTQNPKGTFQRYLSLAALDTVFTKITAVVMKVTNGAKKAHMPKEIGDDDTPSADPNSVDEIHFIKSQAEEQRLKEARQAEEGEHAKRIRADKPETAPRDPNLLRKKPIEKTENFTTGTERSNGVPAIG